MRRISPRAQMVLKNLIGVICIKALLTQSIKVTLSRVDREAIFSKVTLLYKHLFFQHLTKLINLKKNLSTLQIPCSLIFFFFFAIFLRVL